MRLVSIFPAAVIDSFAVRSILPPITLVLVEKVRELIVEVAIVPLASMATFPPLPLAAAVKIGPAVVLTLPPL
ncbi:MAG: hypothetical protein EAZ88_25230 [Oscillatoriales cyanobacterium]|nr:MAG: hypothetical protein EAZ88_25230 [Oscillatoriales cyanobacterium]TAH24871.1 MAG: hypothetical protein EAZ10_11620 [Oscillatoriales cyanobacterium]